MAVGLGLIRDRLKNNNLTTKYGPFIAEVFQNDLSIKTIPLQLVCRYWLGGFDRFSYCVYGAVQLHHASWKMKTSFNQYVARGAIGFMNMENENASGRGVGFAAGGRGEWQFYENIGLTVDLSARYAPLRNFSGERVYTYRGQAQGPLFQRGDLWFYEYYNVGLGKWSWELGIGGRPAGSGTRNVSRATVDFSGMAVRVGLLFRF